VETLDGSVSKIEYLCDAIAEYTGSHDPRSEAYKRRNPLALREKEVIRDANDKVVDVKFHGLRRFRSWVHGYEAGLYDLRIKCSGKHRTLTQYSSIGDLTGDYGLNGDTAKNVANYLSFALEDEGITAETKLFVFLK
jgi:hypothetical protein